VGFVFVAFTDHLSGVYFSLIAISKSVSMKSFTGKRLRRFLILFLRENSGPVMLKKLNGN
jgi:hypothetical protein